MNELSGPEREQELHVLRQVLGVTYAGQCPPTIGTRCMYLISVPHSWDRYREPQL